MFSSHLFGRILLKPFRLALDTEPLRSFLLSIALGYIFLSAFVFILLALKIGYAITFASFVYLTGSLGLLMTYKQFLSAFRHVVEISVTKGNSLRRLLAFSLLFFLIITFYITLAPTTAWDGLAYHYPLPYLWLKSHSFYNIPTIIYSNFPSSAELIFLLGFAANSDIAANHLTWFAGFLCILYLFYFGNRYFTPETALAAGIIFYSYPIIYVEELQGGYIDLFQVFYIFAALDLLYEWISTRTRFSILLAAAFMGFTLCIKHSGYFTFIFFLSYLIVILIKSKLNRAHSIIDLILFIIIPLLFPLGWYIKSYIYTGNPIYPFLYHAFGGTCSTAPDIMYWANPKVTMGFFQTIFYPFFASLKVSMVQFPFRLLPPSLIALIPFIILRFKRNSFTLLILSYSIFFIVLISIIEPGEPRYNLAAWAFLCLPAVDSAMGFGATAKWFRKLILPFFIIFPLAFGSIYISMRYLNYRHCFIWSNQDVKAYYSGSKRYRPIDYYPIIKWLNNNLNDSHGRLLFAESRVFLLNNQIDYIVAYPFQTDDLWDWDTVSINDIPAILKQYRIKYIAFDYGPNYRAICEAWFIIHDKREVRGDDPQVLHDVYGIGMGNEHFMLLAGYSNPHIKYIKEHDISSTLVYDGRFRNIDELFASKGNVDAKLIASIMWCSENGVIRKVFDDKAGAIFEVVK